MKIANTRLKKFFLILGSIIIAVVVLVILFISPIAKYLIEKYDEKYTGREITMDWAYVNPFTGYVYFSNFKVLEAKKDTLFFSANSVSANFEMMKMLSKTYEISSLTLDHPRGTITQKKGASNFDDLVIRFSPDSTGVQKEPVHFNILNITIEHGDFYYQERVIPIHYVVRDLNLESTGKRWNADTIRSTFNFLSQDGNGKMKGDLTLNVKTHDYRLATSIHNFDLEIIRQYLWELINYGMFSAKLDATIKMTGNFKNKDSIDVRGRFTFKDFHLGKTKKDDYASFEKLHVVIDELSPLNKKFLFDSIKLTHPFFKYEKFDSLNNMEMLFGKNGSNISDVTSQEGRFNLIIEIGRYIKDLSKNFFQSHYKVNRFIVEHGDLRYGDFSLSEEYVVDLKDLSIRADSVDKKNTRIHVYTRSAIKPYGDLAINLSINPRDSGYFDMTYHIKKIPVSSFNPYLITYTSFPLDKGTIEFNGVWNVRDGEIKSVNHLLMTEPRVAKRIHNEDLKWIPLPLIMAFVRERGSVIDYEIPITGNLKNPHFSLSDVITDLLKNIFIKPVTIPYGIEVKNTEKEIENTLALKWDMRQRTMRPKQRNFVEKIAKFLQKNGDASIKVYPKLYTTKEKEYILFFEAKKKYFLQTHHKTPANFTKEDSAQVDKMSIKDHGFMHAVKRGVSDTSMFTIQEKCFHFVGHAKVDVKYNQLVKEREREFKSFFASNGTEKRMKIYPVEESVPYNGFSFFKIHYEGELPKPLRKAYEEMHELNDESPRDKYFKGNP